MYPGYTGALESKGEVMVTFNDDYMFLIRFKDGKGIEVDCMDWVDCSIQIHRGISCVMAAKVWPHYWNKEVVRDIWPVGRAVYNTDQPPRSCDSCTRLVKSGLWSSLF
jgi:hypothetical protein